MLLLLMVMMPLLPYISAYNYCHNKSHFCMAANTQHFMCRLDAELPSVATYRGTIPDTKGLQGIILHLLNTYRDKVASGDLKTRKNKAYPGAKRMRQLIWDLELGYMARSHAATVSFKHSECRATQRFPMAGEALGVVGATTDRRSMNEILKLSLDRMFYEHLNVEDPESLVSYFDASIHMDAGHFCVIISDRVSRVGCGIAVATDCGHDEPTGHCHFLTCHFDFTNIHGSYVYLEGTPASDCQIWGTEPSKQYYHLCGNDGSIFAQDHGDDDLSNKTRVLGV
ncbi:venom allergen 3-like [Drosophila guanche]|uniref:Blast:Venom allergen 3 n=1 Tax=Drosophila guanche TaxID=7266 RepID=A0A3B0JJ42_DROGU|nr:venom allergen 3-like [Drosophila guanche]SPP73246.1 blast:Venom allergen 3 [Drosophila guanche]